MLTMLKLLKQLWERIRAGLMFFGKVQSIIILTLFYYLILGPVAVVRTALSFFVGKARDSSGFWEERESEVETEETLLRQF